PLGQYSMLAAVRPADADVRPVVARILLEMAVLVEDPFAVRRPAGSEVEMVRMPGNSDTIPTVDIARPHLISPRTRQMKGNPLAIRTQAQAVWQSLACFRKLPCVCAI